MGGGEGGGGGGEGVLASSVLGRVRVVPGGSKTRQYEFSMTKT